MWPKEAVFLLVFWRAKGTCWCKKKKLSCNSWFHSFCNKTGANSAPTTRASRTKNHFFWSYKNFVSFLTPSQLHRYSKAQFTVQSNYCCKIPWLSSRTLLHSSEGSTPSCASLESPSTDFLCQGRRWFGGSLTAFPFFFPHPVLSCHCWVIFGSYLLAVCPFIAHLSFLWDTKALIYVVQLHNREILWKIRDKRNELNV